MAVSTLSANRKYRRLATTIVLLVVLVSVQPFLWRFVHRQALQLQQKRSQGQQIANVQARNQEVEKTLHMQRGFLDQLELVSPPTTSLTQAVERVEQLGDQLGLLVTITVIQEVPASNSVVKEDDIVPVAVSVDTVGSANQLLSFLDRVEHTQELSIVPRWGLTPVTLSSTYMLNMDILFFLRRMPDG